MKVQRAIVVTLMSTSALASHFKVLHQSFLGELSSMGTSLVHFFDWDSRKGKGFAYRGSNFLSF